MGVHHTNKNRNVVALQKLNVLAINSDRQTMSACSFMLPAGVLLGVNNSADTNTIVVTLSTDRRLSIRIANASAAVLIITICLSPLFCIIHYHTKVGVEENSQSKWRQQSRRTVLGKVSSDVNFKWF